ncbi:hypothetical protein L1987_34099 [Smallanthus sonchifolius]|uniref:Uncharacterized protein n=1 Tax=Smallanthus sonchifolius TaxID=185202 RepID=A0ACB9HUA8_9ASTR|nr:hypothetical protein L1987_34099 [Smallanthus sonchifolius]
MGSGHPGVVESCDGPGRCFMDKHPVSSSSQAVPPFPSENLKSSIIESKYVWATLIVCSFILFIAIVLCLCNKKKLLAGFKQQMVHKKVEKMDAHELMLRKFQVEELETATNNFAEECLIGSGAFGNVYKGTFEGDVTLAIKKARDDSYTSIQEFRNGEVTLKGEASEPRWSSRLLRRNWDRFPLTWRQRVNIAIEAAKGRHKSSYATKTKPNQTGLARPHLERGSVEEILDANLLLEPCNMDIMLKMGLLGLRCVVKEPKQRPTMTQVYKELEAALWSANSHVHRRLPPQSSTAFVGVGHGNSETVT